MGRAYTVLFWALTTMTALSGVGLLLQDQRVYRPDAYLVTFHVDGRPVPGEVLMILFVACCLNKSFHNPCRHHVREACGICLWPDLSVSSHRYDPCPF